MMIMKEKYGRILILQFMDLEKFFDSEVLSDVLCEAWRNQVRNKPYRLLFEMNRKRMIKVQTAVGDSEEEEVAEGLGQGGLDSAILSAGSIGNGTEDFFGRSEQEIYYEDLRLQPTAFQDDLMRTSETIDDVRAEISKFEAMANTNLLSFNSSKSALVVLGPKKLRESKINELESNPIKLVRLGFYQL